MREMREIFCFAMKDVLRYGVSLCGTPDYEGGEEGEVWRGNLVGIADDGFGIGELPQVEDGGEQGGGAAFRDRAEAQVLLGDSLRGFR